MKSSVLVSVFALVGIVACGDSGSSTTTAGGGGSGGSGGSGASGSTESTGGTTNTAGNGSGANGVGGNGVGPTGPGPGAGGASSCGTISVCQDTDQDPSNDCVSCAFTSACSDQYMACTNSTDCIDVNTCLSKCAEDDAPCQQGCLENNPAGAALYQEVILCAVCDTCYDACDGATAGCP
jgi:hypothetical protein